MLAGKGKIFFHLLFYIFFICRIESLTLLREIIGVTKSELLFIYCHFKIF